MSLDVYLESGGPDMIPHQDDPYVIYEANITHNLGVMANAAGIYQELWHPDEIGITTAGELIAPLTIGLNKMKADPERYKKFDATNGWGLYEDFVPWIEKYLRACRANPTARVRTST